MFEQPKLNNRYLRQVAWAIFSPSLLNYSASIDYIRDKEHYKEVITLLKNLDAQNEIVESYFKQVPKKPLGKYFESLLHFILEKDNRYEIVLKNHQIIEEKRTIGEIDLIIRDTKTNLLEHWEVALKFYLQSQPSPMHKLMIGPNGKDNLSRKMKKLVEHQLPLSSRLGPFESSRTQSIENKLLLKGQFFYHISHNQGRNIIPNQANLNHQSGWWCHIKEIDSSLDKNLSWKTIEKSEWIGLKKENEDHNSLTINQFTESIKQYFKNNTRAIMCVGLKQEKNLFIEQTRGFVVSNDWPNTL